LNIQRHLWIAVLAVGVAASVGLYSWLASQQQRALQIEIGHRSALKLTAAQQLIDEHVSMASATIGFLNAEVLGHEYMGETEAVAFIHRMLDMHPSEFLDMAILPPAGHGDAVRMIQGGKRVAALNPPVREGRLVSVVPGEPQFELVPAGKDSPSVHKMRLLLSSLDKPYGYAVVDMDITYLLIAAISDASPAGLDLDITALAGGRAVPLLHHISRSRKAEEEEEEENLRWQRGFNIGGLGFVMRAYPAPALRRLFITSMPLQAALFSLLFFLLLALIAYNRSRYGEKLRLEVAKQTHALERERRKLEESEEKHRGLVETTPMGIVIHEQGVVRYANPAMAAMLGIQDATFLLGKNVLDFVADADRPKVIERMQRTQHGADAPPVEEKLVRADGASFPTEVQGIPITYNGNPAVQVLIQDISERKQAEISIRESEEKFRNLSEESPNMIFINQGGRVVYANARCEKIMGYSIDEFCAPDFDFQTLVAPESLDTVTVAFAAHRKGEDVPPYECALITRNGRKLETIHTTRIISFDGSPAVLGTITDISVQKKTEERLAWLSYYDELTKLPNRRLFADRLRQVIAAAQREKGSAALLYFDLDRFKIINDSLGHACGDEVLKATGARMLDLLREMDTPARMGGDEFAVLLPGADANTALRVASKLRDALQQPHHLARQEVSVDASIGIALFPKDGEHPEDLLKHADAAMYYAKQHSSQIHYFSEDIEKAAIQGLKMEQYLASAADENQLKLYYQSQHQLVDGLADARAGGIIGVESLVRWRHPELGLVSPADFIPLAETTGLIRPISYWVLGAVARQALDWEKAGIRPQRISVNLSAVQLMQKGLAQDILAHLRETGAKPEWIEIEITETAAMSDPDTAIAIMCELAEAGISIAIDDFGTGYSSLAYLKRLPAEWLKIDIAFIRGLPDDEEDAAIVRSTIAMAHALGMKTLAEGVETVSQLDFLRGEGCDAVQGYLFSKPMPAGEATSFIKNHLK